MSEQTQVRIYVDKNIAFQFKAVCVLNGQTVSEGANELLSKAVQAMKENK